MSSRGFVLLAVTCICIATVLADEVWVVRPDGFGPAKVGMTLPQLNAALTEKLSKPIDNDDQSCFYLKPAKHPHISFMIENGRFSRVDVDAPDIATAEGIQVGDPEAKAIRVYGPSLKVEPHHYIEDGHYLTLHSHDVRYGMRFETEKGKITAFYAGRFEAVQYVEGCL